MDSDHSTNGNDYIIDREDEDITDIEDDDDNHPETQKSVRIRERRSTTVLCAY